MRQKFKQSGLTLIEMVVVIASVALLVALGLPAVRALTKSFESQAGTRAMISAAMASARAIAAKEQRYAGVRFQNADDKGSQYVIFIVHDFDKTDLENGFRAAEGIQPIKLPDSVGVMEVVTEDGDVDSDSKLRGKTIFSIIFSPSGKLVIHEIRIKRINSKDDIFNTKLKVEDGIGMFLQDDWPPYGLGEELSQNRFIIYDKTEFEKIDENDRWTDYLSDLDIIHINPYTGTMINK